LSPIRDRFNGAPAIREAPGCPIHDQRLDSLLVMARRQDVIGLTKDFELESIQRREVLQRSDVGRQEFQSQIAF
jgi:hypothetical protein